MAEVYDILVNLPAELRLTILLYLNVNQICNCSYVSIEWREVTNSDYLWRKLCLRDLDTNGKYVDLPHIEPIGNIQPTCRFKKIYATVKKTLFDWEHAEPTTIAELTKIAETIYGRHIMASVYEGDVNFFFLCGHGKHIQHLPPILEQANTWEYSWVGGSNDELFVLRASKKCHTMYLCYIKTIDKFHCDCVINIKNTELVYADNPILTEGGIENIKSTMYPSGVVQNILIIPIPLEEEVELHFCAISLRKTINKIRISKNCSTKAWRSFKDYFCFLSTEELSVYNANGTLTKNLDCHMDVHYKNLFNTDFNKLNESIKHEIQINESVILAGFMIVIGQDPFCVANKAENGIMFLWDKATGHLIKTIVKSMSHICLHRTLPLVIYLHQPLTLVIDNIHENSSEILDLYEIGMPSKYTHPGNYLSGKYLTVYRKYQDMWGRDTLWCALIDVENRKIHKDIIELYLKSIRKITRDIVEGYHRNTERYSQFRVQRIIRH